MKSLKIGIIILFFIVNKNIYAQTIGRNSYEAAIGIHSFYLPFNNYRFENAQPAFLIGSNHSINTRQTLELGFRLGYNRNKYQGDALYVQALFRFAPIIAKHFQPMLATGLGYQLSFYPSNGFRYINNSWVNSEKPKGVIQVPIQLGLGFNSLKIDKASINPYFAYHLNALFRYSPDLTPLPSSQFILGFRYTPLKN